MSDFQFQVMVSSQQYHKFTNCITENIKLQKRIKELSDQLEKNHERRDMMQMTIKNMQIKIRQLSKNSLKLSRGLISEKQDHEKTQQNGIVRQRQLLEKVLALTRERDLSYQNIDMLKQSLKKIMKEVENGKQSKRLLECRYKETVGIWEKVKKDNEELKQNIQKLVMTNKELSAQKEELIRLKENIMEQNERLKMELLSQSEVIFSKIKKYEQEVKSLLSDLQNCRNRQQYLSLSKEKDKIQYEQQIQAKNNEIDQLIQQKSYQLSVIKALDQSNQNYKISKINLSAKCQSLSEDILAMKQQWRQLLIWRKMISQMNFTQFGEQIKSYVGQLIQRNLKSQQQLKSLSYWQHIMPQMISKKQILEKDKIKEKYQVLAIEFKLILAEIESSFKRWLDSC